MSCGQGEEIEAETAERIAAALHLNVNKAFTIRTEYRELSANSIRDYHRLIHIVLAYAVKEGLILYNVAERSTPPKVTPKEVECFRLEEVEAIRDALETEPIKWKVLVHLFLITGARRGEVLGLKWSAIDLEKGKVHICNSILYAPDIGVYGEYTQNRKIRPAHCYSGRNGSTLKEIPGMAKWGTVATRGGIIRTRTLCLRRITGIPCTLPALPTVNVNEYLSHVRISI